MCNYLTIGALTGDEKMDRKILLVADQYFLVNDLLYKLSLPMSRREQRIRSFTERLCVPEAFRFDLMNHVHNFGHYGKDKLFLGSCVKYYWYALFSDVSEFVASCDICTKARRNFAAKTNPLHPLDIPSRPFEVVQSDHRPLPRKTASGKTGILLFIDAYRGWICLQAVSDIHGTGND